MVSILFIHDDKLLATPGTVRKLLDPASGTGGMLAEAQNYLREHHSAARLYVYGQDYNKRAFATAASDMLMKEVDHNGGANSIRFGDSFTEDQFGDETFDYFLTNPPFGVEWKKQHREIEREHEKLGFTGRFGAGLPRVNDGSLLFLQHMIHKFERVRPGRAQTWIAARHRVQRLASIHRRLLNRFRLLGQASCIDNNMMGLVLDGSRADKRFMLHSLALVDFGEVANPGAVPSLNAEQVAEQSVLLPPLPT